MKKILFLAICVLSFAALKAQTFTTFTSGHIAVVADDSMFHDSTNCNIYSYITLNITIDSSYVGDTVYVVDTASGSLDGGGPVVNTTGVSPWTFSMPLGGESWDDYHTLGGVPGYAYSPNWVSKVISGLDTLRYVTTLDTLYVSNPCQYSTVSGYIFDDYHGDCTFDSGDVGLFNIYPNITEYLSSSVDSMVYAPYWVNIGGSGYYQYVIQKSWMVSYTVSMPAYYSFIFPSSSCFTPYAPFTVLPDTGVNFPLECSSSCDVMCNALSPGSVRFGRSFYMQPYVSNTGCDTQSGVFTFILDSRVIYDSALSVYPPDTLRGDTLIWNYSGLTNLTNSGTAFWNNFMSGIFLSPDSAVAVGDTLCFSGYCNVPATDVNPLNNSFSFCIPVVYSHDPNSKAVSPQGTGTQGYIPDGPDTLTYTIHFQNTGSASAYNINVIDTLDSHINASTLKILGTSATMFPQWLAPGVVEFTYNNINLPDSGDNFAASQGAVQFSVVLNAGLAPGTQIHNTGYIYFDSNPAVITNTTLNTLDSTLLQTATVPTVSNIITIYPNPAITQLTIESTNQPITRITITNLLGQTILTQLPTANCQLAQVNISALSPGVYFVKVNGTETRKFVKE